MACGAPEDDARFDLEENRNLAGSVLEVDRHLHTPGSTSPSSLVTLDHMVGVFIFNLERFGPAEGPRTAQIIAELGEYRRPLMKALLVWPGDRTLVDLRAEWVALRDRHFKPHQHFRESSSELDAIQSVLNPEQDYDVFERIAFLESQYEGVINLAADLELTHSDRQARKFQQTVGPWLAQIGGKLRRPPLKMPDGAPMDIARAWRLVGESPSLLRACLGTPWPGGLIVATRRQVPSDLAKLREARDRVAGYFDADEIPTATFEAVYARPSRRAERVRSAEVTLLGHEGPVREAVFSPHGFRVITASSDTTARIWNADGSGGTLVLEGHVRDVRGVAFNRHGTRVATASDDTSARIWNADGSGEFVSLDKHRAPVWTVAFSPDESRLLTTSMDRIARLWRTDGTGEAIVLSGHSDTVWGAAFSPDGARILTASSDRTARIWDADGSGEPVVLEGHEGWVRNAAFSPDGTRVVTASDDGTARIWNADGSGEPIQLEGHEDKVTDAAFSPDGRHVVTASLDRTARVWRADGSGEPIVLEGHEDTVNSADFSPDGSLIVTVSEDNTARVWNALGSGATLVLLGHDGRINSAAFSADGSRVVTASDDGSARIWSAGTS